MKNPTLDERIDRAIERVARGDAPMRIPVDQTDADIVLHDCQKRIAELEAALTTLGAKEVSVIRAEERERCAKVCDNAASVHGIAQDCARMIRKLEGE